VGKSAQDIYAMAPSGSTNYMTTSQSWL
jgi:hypothetical protein